MNKGSTFAVEPGPFATAETRIVVDKDAAIEEAQDATAIQCALEGSNSLMVLCLRDHQPFLPQPFRPKDPALLRRFGIHLIVESAFPAYGSHDSAICM